MYQTHSIKIRNKKYKKKKAHKPQYGAILPSNSRI